MLVLDHQHHSDSARLHQWRGEQWKLPQTVCWTRTSRRWWQQYFEIWITTCLGLDPFFPIQQQLTASLSRFCCSKDVVKVSSHTRSEVWRAGRITRGFAYHDVFSQSHFRLSCFTSRVWPCTSQEPCCKKIPSDKAQEAQTVDCVSNKYNSILCDHCSLDELFFVTQSLGNKTAKATEEQNTERERERESVCVCVCVLNTYFFLWQQNAQINELTHKYCQTQCCFPAYRLTCIWIWHDKTPTSPWKILWKQHRRKSL